MTQTPLAVLGVPGSPYTRKLIAVLRYRHIPYRVLWRGPEGLPADLPRPKVDLQPTVYFPDGQGGLSAQIDTTPIIRRLEAEHPARGVAPADPALRFLDALIEDFADEWLTKAMFHFRWAHERDAKNAEPLLVFWADPSMEAEAARQWGADFAKRQIARLYVVGSNEVTAATIEASYQRLLSALDAVIARQAFVMGARPGAGDFALLGQLTQLLMVEPTSSEIAARTAPRLRPWVERMEDLSGLEPAPEDWLSRDAVAETLAPLLAEIGRVYAPFLLANAAAAERGEARFETEIDGRAWTQPVFPYQVKCLHALREGFSALPKPDQATLRGWLSGTGADALFE